MAIFMAALSKNKIMDAKLKKSPAEMTPGDRLQEIIFEKRTSQEKLAAEIGVTQSAISQFVKGKTTHLKKLHAAANVL
ncbi:MAG TPA: hypothetical protein DIW20_05765, partial [Rhodospirillaceae bacterium]|nr:hypothetical protein [Rhodospirillaceae bacterium]